MQLLRSHHVGHYSNTELILQRLVLEIVQACIENCVLYFGAGGAAAVAGPAFYQHSLAEGAEDECVVDVAALCMDNALSHRQSARQHLPSAMVFFASG